MLATFHKIFYVGLVHKVKDVKYNLQNNINVCLNDC